MSTVFKGQRRYKDLASGQEFDAQTVVKEVGDVGFHKVWLTEILDIVNEVGNKKMKVLMWLLANADAQNRIHATWEMISEGTGVGRSTVASLMATLRAVNVLSEVRRSVWRLNPDVIFKGEYGKRMSVLHIYQHEKVTQGELFEKVTPEDRPTPRPANHLQAVQ